MAIYDIVVTKDKWVVKILELVNFSFVFEELKHKCCRDNGRNGPE